MRARNRWLFSLMVLAGALLVAFGNWGTYRGDDVRAQVAISFSSSEFKCYVINHGDAPARLNNVVTLADQFSDADDTPAVEGVNHVVREPQLLCAPAQKTRVIDGSPVSTPASFSELDTEGPHLKCYNITPAGPPTRDEVTLCDQFNGCTLDEAGNLAGGGDAVKVQTSQLLCTLACKGRAGEPLAACPFATPSSK